MTFSSSGISRRAGIEMSAIMAMAQHPTMYQLIQVLEVPSREISEAAMQALYIITGEKLLRKDQWQDWYRTRYPDWLKKKQQKSAPK